MSNMSYCRFQNTLGDLQDCLDSLDGEPLSAEEAGAARDMVESCKEFLAAVKNYGINEEEEEEEDEDEEE